MKSFVELFDATDRGDPVAAGALFAALYDELHELAARQLRRAGGDITLGTTTLLHEAYLKVAAQERDQALDRTRFLAYPCATRKEAGWRFRYHAARRPRPGCGE